MPNAIRLAAFVALISTVLFAGSSQIRQPKPQWKLVWSDEFDRDGLPDPQKWSYDTAGNATAWGNNELQHYTAQKLENAEVKNGKLWLTALRAETATKPYTSARLLSNESWRYGKIDVCAKLPRGRGLWPAVWMLPTDRKYGGWPASGEIDIMEHVGYEPDSVYSTVHTKSYNHLIATQRGSATALPDCAETFHCYQMEWNENEITFSVDNQLIFRFANEKKSPDEWPFDCPFHLLLNVAVGGNWGGARGVDNRVFPQAMQVDYVRVYQKINPH